MIVLGRSNQAAVEVYEERCHEDGVPIVRRRYGGAGSGYGGDFPGDAGGSSASFLAIFSGNQHRHY
jgi:hypothetical protein